MYTRSHRKTVTHTETIYYTSVLALKMMMPLPVGFPLRSVMILAAEIIQAGGQSDQSRQNYFSVCKFVVPYPVPQSEARQDWKSSLSKTKVCCVRKSVVSIAMKSTPADWGTSLPAESVADASWFNETSWNMRESHDDSWWCMCLLYKPRWGFSPERIRTIHGTAQITWIISQLTSVLFYSVLFVHIEPSYNVMIPYITNYYNIIIHNNYLMWLMICFFIIRTDKLIIC